MEDSSIVFSQNACKSFNACHVLLCKNWSSLFVIPTSRLISVQTCIHTYSNMVLPNTPSSTHYYARVSLDSTSALHAKAARRSGAPPRSLPVFKIRDRSRVKRYQSRVHPVSSGILPTTKDRPDPTDSLQSAPQMSFWLSLLLRGNSSSSSSGCGCVIDPSGRWLLANSY